jgi:Phage ABA sandwich domain
MTKDEILKLEEGEIIDNLVAVDIMGWHIAKKESDNRGHWEDRDGHHMAGMGNIDSFEDDEDIHSLHWHPSYSEVWARDILEQIQLVTTIAWLPKSKKYVIMINDKTKPVVNITVDNPCLGICQAALLWKEYSKQ